MCMKLRACRFTRLHTLRVSRPRRMPFAALVLLQGIAENTLVVWWSDNGPMYAFFPNSGVAGKQVFFGFCKKGKEDTHKIVGVVV